MADTCITKCCCQNQNSKILGGKETISPESSRPDEVGSSYKCRLHKECFVVSEILAQLLEEKKNIYGLGV